MLYPRLKKTPMFSVLCLLFVYAQSAAVEYVSPADLKLSLVGIIDQVNVDSILYFVKELSGEIPTRIDGQLVTIQSRNIYFPGNDLATRYIQQKLTRYGLDVHTQAFTNGENVYGLQQGVVKPDEFYMICAHYDGKPYDAFSPAADDNASGVAAVLESARILSRYSLPYSINYALWDAEEYGLSGSFQYANYASAAGEIIHGVFNLDMIAWEGNGDNRFNVFYKNLGISLEMASTMAQLTQTLNLNLVPLLVNDDKAYSDHYCFWQQGYSAVMLIEDYYQNQDFNPYYHTSADSLAHFDVPFFTNCTKLAVATLAHYTDNYEEIRTLTYHFPGAGWYFISIPGTTDDMSVGTLFPEALPYAFGYHSGYVDRTVFEPAEGYWLYVTQTCTSTFDVQPIYQYVKIIEKPGWYMIGSVIEDVPLGDVLITPAGAMQGNLWDYGGSGYTETQVISSQGSYWALFYQPCTLTVATTPHILSKGVSQFVDVLPAESKPPVPPVVENTGVFETLPSRLNLSQNYPNPFNASTTLEFVLPKVSEVSVQVFNVRGEMVRFLEHQVLNAGVHKVKWDGRDNTGKDVPSGSYLMYVAAGEEQQVAKMILIR
ncbi:M28 family peptidase [candidate division KSB1 bacterium]|nr:M28 family peptidase [candidate division KSB1 bacterium]